MIRIYDTEEKTYQTITPTMFPDGTSQVWKIGVSKYVDKDVKVVWNFESEAELIWVIQLIHLLRKYDITVDELFIPYLPYARQDKPISDESTFAKYSFESILKAIKLESVFVVTTLDAHSDAVTPLIIHSYSPEVYIKMALEQSRATAVVFPDKGAHNRYVGLGCLEGIDVITLDKVRDQSTGKITSLELNNWCTSFKFVRNHKLSSVAYNFLIVDDICDGGATFALASAFLHANYKCNVSLYVTHGIYSKGFEPLVSAGIIGFYTTQSLPRNVAGYPLDNLLR